MNKPTRVVITDWDGNRAWRVDRFPQSGICYIYRTTPTGLDELIAIVPREEAENLSKALVGWEQ